MQLDLGDLLGALIGAAVAWAALKVQLQHAERKHARDLEDAETRERQAQAREEEAKQEASQLRKERELDQRFAELRAGFDKDNEDPVLDLRLAYKNLLARTTPLQLRALGHARAKRFVDEVNHRIQVALRGFALKMDVSTGAFPNDPVDSYGRAVLAFAIQADTPSKEEENALESQRQSANEAAQRLLQELSARADRR